MTRLKFILFALLFSASASAGPLRFSAGLWDYKVTGHDVDNGVRRDFQRDLAVQPAGQLRLAAEYDWRESWYLDLAATYSTFGGDGSTTVQNGGGLLGIGSGSSTVTTTHADLRDVDFTARWPFEFGDFTFSPGLSLQKLDGEVLIEDRGNNTVSRQNVNEIFPQVHGELRWQPADRFSVSGVVQAISSGEQAAGEYRVLAGWQIYGPVLLQAGWQEKRYDLKQPRFEIHARLRGLLFQAGFLF